MRLLALVLMSFLALGLGSCDKSKKEQTVGSDRNLLAMGAFLAASKGGR